MKYVLEVCLIALTLVKSITPSPAARTSAAARENFSRGVSRALWCAASRCSASSCLAPFASFLSFGMPFPYPASPGSGSLVQCRFLLSEGHFGAGQTIGKGITVELPVTTNAVAAPKADREDSLIVTVTYDSKVYFGIEPTRPTALTEKVKRAMSNRADKTLYIKADARTAYRNLVVVLDSVRTAGVEGLTLLTVQPDGEEPGTLVPPKGLEMLLVSPRPAVPSAAGSR
jgi:biopolymer transport protein ExbD